jgi:hypothetical protein
MKKIFMFFLFSGPGVFLFTACEKDNNDNEPVYPLPPQAIVDYIASTFSTAAAGVNYHMENAAYLAGVTHTPLHDSTFIIKTDTSLPTKYDYSVEYTLGANSPAQNQFTLQYDVTGWFKTATLSSAETDFGQFTVSGLEASATDYGMTGSGTQGGSLVTKQYGNMPFSCTVRYTLKSVVLDKTSNKILSGGATIINSGVGPTNLGFSYSGTLTFNGNRKATLVFNGTTYQLDLGTGTYSK